MTNKHTEEEMNKLYYDCPISAAYMTKNFGVLMANQYGNNLLAEISNGNQITWFETGVDKYCKNNFYIHPDSLSIFEPQLKDIAVRKDYVQSGCHPFIVFDDDIKEMRNRVHEYYILLRNGKPFIMPIE